MAEDQSFVPQTETQFSVVGLSTEDITPTVYEGGFKTWECSVDLANYVLSELKSDEDSRMPSRPYWHIIEVTHSITLFFLRSCTNRLPYIWSNSLAKGVCGEPRRKADNSSRVVGCWHSATNSCMSLLFPYANIDCSTCHPPNAGGLQH